jgi:hypothetical protein
VASVEVDTEGIPADHSDAWLDLAEPAGVAASAAASGSAEAAADDRELVAVG